MPMPNMESGIIEKPGKVPVSSVPSSPGYYTPPPQPLTTPRGGVPRYWLGAEDFAPAARTPINTQQQLEQGLKDIWQQVIPTSVNIRNRMLQSLLQSQATPLEHLYVGQGIGQASEQRAGSLDQLRNAMAQRGLMNSGAVDEATLGTELGYLGNVSNASMAARQAEQQRQHGILSELLGLSEADLNFYNAIRSGTLQAGTLFDNKSADYRMAAKGIGTAVRSAASAAAGGGGGSIGSGGTSSAFAANNAYGGMGGYSGMGSGGMLGGGEGMSGAGGGMFTFGG